MLTQQDLKQLAQKGISEQQIETQLGKGNNMLKPGSNTRLPASAW